MKSLNLAPVLLLTLFYITTINATEEFTAQRLTWSGVKLIQGDTSVFIDAVGKDLWDGNAPEGLVPVEATTKRRYAVITHIHNDHLDVDTLKQVLGEKGYVISHTSSASYLVSKGLKVIETEFYVPVMRGGFVFTPVPAQDGFGDHQVSWIIAAGDKRIIHAGDTLWHGQWHTLGLQYGPFDAAFLPINAAVVPGTGSYIPAVMSPKQAVNAAKLLRAKTIVPIHYGLPSSDQYKETPNPVAAAMKEGKNIDVWVQHRKPGDTIQWQKD